MKAIILAGGTGSRLYPTTLYMSKQLQLIYDKPTIYYSLSIVMLSGIRDIAIVTNPEFVPHYQKLLGDGTHLGLNIQYFEQSKPNGIAEVFLVCRPFIDTSIMLCLGDNFFYGDALSSFLQNKVKSFQDGAHLFCSRVKNPEEFGILNLDENNQKPLFIEEKPKNPKSHLAVTGLYLYSEDVKDIVKDLQPSPRGELEITDVNNIYIQQNRMSHSIFGRGVFWKDTGTPDSLQEVSNFVSIIKRSEQFSPGCIEEVAYHMKYISKETLENLTCKMPNSEYKKYLLSVLE